MGKAPLCPYKDLDELIAALLDKMGDISLIKTDGQVIGGFVSWLGKTQEVPNGSYEVFCGDQIVFTTIQKEEV
jgi:hypothetical protein